MHAHTGSGCLECRLHCVRLWSVDNEFKLITVAFYYSDCQTSSSPKANSRVSVTSRSAALLDRHGAGIRENTANRTLLECLSCGQLQTSLCQPPSRRSLRTITATEVGMP